MKPIVSFLISLLVTVLLASAASAVPHVTIENGIWMGATNVDVSGTLYDVQFLDGSCASLFSGCDEQSDSLFDGTTGQNAVDALIFQVWGGGPH